MDFWHDYPVIKDKQCVRCGKTPVHVMLTTGVKLHLQCKACGNHWDEPERRKSQPRPAADGPP
jgi:hypothetical protein